MVVHRPDDKRLARRPLVERSEYSSTLGRIARFTLTHKSLVIGVWIAVGVVLAVLFPQLETVVRQQSVDPIPAGVPSFQALDQMGGAFGEKGAKTTVFVTMENPNGLTEVTRERYDALVLQLRENFDDVQSVRDLLSDPITARQASSLPPVQLAYHHCRRGEPWLGMAGLLLPAGRSSGARSPANRAIPPPSIREHRGARP